MFNIGEGASLAVIGDGKQNYFSSPQANTGATLEHSGTGYIFSVEDENCTLHIKNISLRSLSTGSLGGYSIVMKQAGQRLIIDGCLIGGAGQQTYNVDIASSAMTDFKFSYRDSFFAQNAGDMNVRMDPTGSGSTFDVKGEVQNCTFLMLSEDAGYAHFDSRSPNNDGIRMTWSNNIFYSASETTYMWRDAGPAKCGIDIIAAVIGSSDTFSGGMIQSTPNLVSGNNNIINPLDYFVG